MKPKEVLEIMDPLLGADFFSYHFAIPKAKFFDSPKESDAKKVPNVAPFLDEESFMDLYLAWHEEGLVGKATVKKTFEESFFPDVVKGDSLEIFIDTRDNKKNRYASKFCHHFAFLPGSVSGISAQEISRFRQDDSHPLCDASELEVHVHATKHMYELSFLIKEKALYGFDPSQFHKLGFAYRMNRLKGRPQHFPFSARRFDLFDHPSLWSSVQLK